MIMEGCQGKPRTPTVSEKICPNCGNRLDVNGVCPNCGHREN